MRQSAIEAAAQSLASSLEGDSSGAGDFDDAVSALIYGDGRGEAPAKPQAEAKPQVDGSRIYPYDQTTPCQAGPRDRTKPGTRLRRYG